MAARAFWAPPPIHVPGHFQDAGSMNFNCGDEAEVCLLKPQLEPESLIGASKEGGLDPTQLCDDSVYILLFSN